MPPAIPGGVAAIDFFAHGSVIISGNVISSFGRGWEFWNWAGTSADAATKGAILIDRGQIPSNPPIANIPIEGNIVAEAEEELGPNGEFWVFTSTSRQVRQLYCD